MNLQGSDFAGLNPAHRFRQRFALWAHYALWVMRITGSARWGYGRDVSTRGAMSILRFLRDGKSEMKKLLILAILAAETPAHADNSFVNGNRAFDMCLHDRSFVNGYVAGAMDAFENARVVTYCVPKGVELGQPAAIYCQYLTAHPEQRHWAGGYLVSLSLAAAWPCHH